jgi:hypothetical protein
MAWSDPGDFTSGQILTAAQMDSIREAMFFGQATFTNETARDAAFGGPLSPIALQEGMRAYLTAPTTAVVDATGAIAAIPSGILTVYNGSVWVCVTPVGAGSNITGTTASASYVTTLTGDGTAVSCKLVTGTTALVKLSCNANAATVIALRTSFSVSGATTLAAADNNGSTVSVPNAGNAIQLNRTLVVTGLTAGVNTFTANYQSVGGGGTGSFTQRALVVQGIA